MRSDIIKKYGDEGIANELILAKESDPALRKCCVRDHPELPQRDDLRLYLCWDSSYECDTEDVVVEQMLSFSQTDRHGKSKDKKSKNKKRKRSTSSSSPSTSSSSDASQDSSDSGRKGKKKDNKSKGKKGPKKVKKGPKGKDGKAKKAKTQDKKKKEVKKDTSSESSSSSSSSKSKEMTEAQKKLAEKKKAKEEEKAAKELAKREEKEEKEKQKEAEKEKKRIEKEAKAQEQKEKQKIRGSGKKAGVNQRNHNELCMCVCISYCSMEAWWCVVNKLVCHCSINLCWWKKYLSIDCYSTNSSHQPIDPIPCTSEALGNLSQDLVDIAKRETKVDTMKPGLHTLPHASCFNFAKLIWNHNHFLMKPRSMVNPDIDVSTDHWNCMIKAI